MNSNRPKYLGRANVVTQLMLDDAMRARQARERRKEAEQAESLMDIIGRFVLFMVIILIVCTAAVQIAMRTGHW